PASCGEILPIAETALASVITSAAPPTARLPRCTKCQITGCPSSAEYSHIEETTMRFFNSMSLKRNSVNSFMQLLSSPWFPFRFPSPERGSRIAPCLRVLLSLPRRWPPQNHATSPSTTSAASIPDYSPVYPATRANVQSMAVPAPHSPGTAECTSIHEIAAVRVREFSPPTLASLPRLRLSSFLRHPDVLRLTRAMSPRQLSPRTHDVISAPVPNHLQSPQNERASPPSQLYCSAGAQPAATRRREDHRGAAVSLPTPERDSLQNAATPLRMLREWPRLDAFSIHRSR